MNRWITLACAALFAATNLCSLVLSASSTLAKAEAVGVPGAALWSAVGVLELVSLAGTLRWLTATTKRGRLHAVVVVGLVAVVTGVAGWASYGWFGLVAPVAVVLTLHMIVETLNDLTAPVTSDGQARATESETAEFFPELSEPTTSDDQRVVEDEWWRDHYPTEAEYAAVILDHLPRDGRRLTQQQILEALQVVSPSCKLHRVKQYRRGSLEVAS